MSHAGRLSPSFIAMQLQRQRETLASVCRYEHFVSVYYILTQLAGYCEKGAGLLTQLSVNGKILIIRVCVGAWVFTFRVHEMFIEGKKVVLNMMNLWTGVEIICVRPQYRETRSSSVWARLPYRYSARPIFTKKLTDRFVFMSATRQTAF